MYTIAPTEVDARTREAWQRYADDLRDINGPAYAAAEADAWERLQEELSEIGAEDVPGCEA